MRILWWSNAPWTHTGYGKQTREAVTRIKALGHDVAIAANFSPLGNAIDWNGITIYPARRTPLGYDTIRDYAEHFYADIVISLYDIWAFPKDIALIIGLPWAAWTPVDGTPVPQGVVDRLTIQMPDAIYVLSMSEFGEEQLDAVGIENTYIPLGIDCEIFKPGDREQAKTTLGIPTDTFMVTMVAANRGYPPRKSWPACLEAFAVFNRRHPESMLYLHTTKKPVINQGMDLPALIKALDVKRVTFVDETEMAAGISDSQMATVYQASDVLLSPSMAEGFGLPIAEAQACGCPVITQMASSMPELTVNGYCIDPLRPLWIPQLSYWWQQADQRKIAMALERVYNFDDETKRYRSAAGTNAMKLLYDWPVVMREYWEPFLERLERELW